MNEMEQRARLRNLDDLASEMDRYEADQFKQRKAAPKVAQVEPQSPGDVPSSPGGEPTNPATDMPNQENPYVPREVDPTGNDRRMYKDNDRQKTLDKVEADSSEAVRKALMSRGQFGQSRKG